MEAHEQGSNEWFKQRLGKATASEIHKIMGVKGIGETGKSYALVKARELCLGEVEEEKFDNADTRRGKELEPLAFAKFKELKAAEFIDVQPTIFFPYGENAGASPDGICGNDAVLEIKSPRIDKFFALIVKGVDAIDKEYYFQMQLQILASNSTHAHFFNYALIGCKEIYHEILVQRDEPVIDLMKARINEFTVIRDEYIAAYKKNAQFVFDK